MTESAARLITGRRVKYVVILFWVVVMTVGGMLFGRLTGVEKNDSKSWLPPKAESTKVLDAQSAFVSPNLIRAVVVYERTSGLTEADKAKISSDAQKLAHLPGVAGQLAPPQYSDDHQAAEMVIPIDLGSQGWSKITKAVDPMKDVLRSGANGLSWHFTGQGGLAADQSTAFAGIDGMLLWGSLGVVVFVLLVTYRSPVLWVLPLLSAGVALITAEGAIYLLARYAGLTVNAQSAGILTVLVLGAGTDYALLLIARYREELRRHESRHEAMAVALHRAWPAIVASGGTVAAGMLCLLLAEVNSTRGLGPVNAVGIVVALAALLTLLPALLVVAGRWVFWPFVPRVGTVEPTSSGMWSRVGNRISGRARLTWVVTAVVLGAMALGIGQLNATGLTNKQQFRGTPDSIVGQTVLEKHFPVEVGAPMAVTTDPAHAAQVRTVFAATKGIDAQTVTPPMIKNGVAFLQGSLTDPADSHAAQLTVDRVRAAVHAVPGAHALAGGITAITMDVENAATHDRDLIIPIMLLVVLLILGVLLRAVVGPVLLIGTVVLSFAAALGASALIFRHVFGYGGADTAVPLYAFVFLVALGIDYNIFLMTRVREEASRTSTRRAAVMGLAATGGVITSAGLVLAGTFTVLGILPVTAFAEIGFIVAFGVLLDTIVVRSILVTALTLDIGRLMWWPSARFRRENEPEWDAALAGESPVPALAEADRPV